MKILIACLLLLAMSAAAQTLTNAEKLTTAERDALDAASQKVAAAQAEYDAVEAAVAANHKMPNEHYMEWSSWHKIDGGWILYYYQSFWNSATPIFADNVVLTPSTSVSLFGNTRDCRPATDGCNTECCTGNVCWETLAYCGPAVSINGSAFSNTLEYRPQAPTPY